MALPEAEKIPYSENGSVFRLKAGRRQKQFSLRALAARVVVWLGSLSQVEFRAKYRRRLASLDRIAQALGMHS